MRIALVMTASTGGIGRHVAGLAPRLVARGHQVLVCCPPATARAHGIDRLAERGDLSWRPLSRLGRARGADVVHAHGYKAIALTAALTRPAGPPLVGSWHNAVLATGRAGQVGRALQRISAHSADLTLGASSDLVVLARALGAGRAELGPVAAPARSVWLASEPPGSGRAGATDPGRARRGGSPGGAERRPAGQPEELPDAARCGRPLAGPQRR